MVHGFLGNADAGFSSQAVELPSAWLMQPLVVCCDVEGCNFCNFRNYSYNSTQLAHFPKPIPFPKTFKLVDVWKIWKSGQCWDILQLQIPTPWIDAMTHPETRRQVLELSRKLRRFAPWLGRHSCAVLANHMAMGSPISLAVCTGSTSLFLLVFGCCSLSTHFGNYRIHWSLMHCQHTETDLSHSQSWQRQASPSSGFVKGYESNQAIGNHLMSHCHISFGLAFATLNLMGETNYLLLKAK